MSSKVVPRRSPQQGSAGCHDLCDSIHGGTCSALQQALELFDRGPVLVTLTGEDGALWGLAASSFSTVSLDDPTVILCVGHSERPHDSLVRNGAFSAHCLSVDDENLVCAFAEPTCARSSLLSWRLDHGSVPIVCEALISLECRTRSVMSARDEMVIIGAVDALRRGPAFDRLDVTHLSSNAGERAPPGPA